MLNIIVEYFHRGTVLSNTQGTILSLTLIYFIYRAIELSIIDIREHRLPNRIVLPLYLTIMLPLIAVYLLEHNIIGVKNTLYSAVLLTLFYYVLRVFSRGGLGLGDVKLSGILGALTGFISPLTLCWATLLTFTFGGIYSLAILLLRTKTPQQHIAFGPFMLLGTILAILFPLPNTIL
ncbi:prepilin peptidase [Rothia sp. P6271]|uniref:prepilin peptidase n=1 Tax=Rothia sp. P6271 TaxID=3402659 RepID=UPI003ACCCD04